MGTGRVRQKQCGLHEMSSSVFADLCMLSVKNRKDVPAFEQVTLLDSETGRLYKRYSDGHVDFVDL